MALDKAKNFIKITVPTGYNSSATAITLAVADLVKLPQPPFNLVWWNSTDFSAPEDDSEVEVIRVTATGTTASPICTITRAQEGTSAKNHNLYAKTYKLINAFTAGMWEGLTGNIGTLHLTPQTAPTTTVSGDIWYDSDRHALTVKSEQAGVSMQIGQENWIRGYNNSGTAIANGRAVRISGSTAGTWATFAHAGTGNHELARVEGLATMDIANNSYGYISTFGVVNDAPCGGFTVGGEVFLVGPSGELGNTHLDVPSHSPQVAVCLNNDSTTGKLQVSILKELLLSDLDDVDDSLSSVPDSVPYYDGTTNSWQASTLRNMGLKSGGLTAQGVTAGTVRVSTSVDFAAASPSYSVGRLFYDSSKDGLAYMKPSVNVYPGAQLQTIYYNGTGGTITKGTVLQIIGQQGQRVLVAKANAVYSAAGSSAFAMGLASHDCNNGDNGYMVCQGLCFDLNTNSWTEGNKLWLSASAGPGMMDNAIPVHPSTEGFIGQVVYKHASAGIIYVNPSYPKSYGPSLTAGMLFGTSNSKGRTWYSVSGLSGITLTMNTAPDVGNRICTMQIGLSGHTGTHTFPGTGAKTHTVVVSNGLITNWTEA